MEFLNTQFRQLFREDEKPEWLESLRGESPLLGSSECKFVADVSSMIKRNMMFEDEISPVSRHAIKRNLPGMKDDFKQVVEHLQMSSSARQQFLRTYLGWRICRQKTITQLKKIAESIDKDKENCEIAKIIGSGVSFLGGGLCLLSDKKEENVAQMIGSVMMGIGNLTTAGTSTVEKILLYENIQAAKEAIRGDREYLKDLWTWVKESTRLLNALENVKAIDVDGSLQVAAKSLQAVFKKDLNAWSKHSQIKTILKSINCPADLVNEFSDVIGMLVSTLMLCERYRHLFNLAVEGSNCIPRLRFAGELFRSAAGLDTALSVNRCAGLTHAQRRKVIGSMASDALNIAFTALQMDSKSMESKKIREAAYALSEEADTYRELYDGMKELNTLHLEGSVYD